MRIVLNNNQTTTMHKRFPLHAAILAAFASASAHAQVARGGRMGLLGNLDTMDTPFNSTEYTSQLIKDQQAASVADILENDPGVGIARGFGNYQQL